MDLLQSGQKISINIEKDDKLVEILATIVEIFDDRLDIELPQYFMRYIEYLDVGKHLTIKVFSKLGTVDFNTVVISSPLEDKFTVEFDYNSLKLTPGEELPVIDAIENLRIIKGEDSFIVKTIQISTEYIKLYSDEPLVQEENFKCELILPEDYGTISFKATVTAKDTVYDNEYTISFYGMNEYDRQTLLYYMYVYTNEYTEQE